MADLGRERDRGDLEGALPAETARIATFDPGSRQVASWQRPCRSATSLSFTTTAARTRSRSSFLRDVEAGTVVNFTDNGWLAAGGFRPGEGTVTYTAPSAITAGTIVTLTGLDLDAAGDQIIAYQGDPATPTILHLVDFGDGNNTVAGDATDDNTTALPPGFTLGVNAVAVAFDSFALCRADQRLPRGLFAALNNSANWLDDDSLPVAVHLRRAADHRSRRRQFERRLSAATTWDSYLGRAGGADLRHRRRHR